MNRLVIIGNGFDLAHGLPTKYQDFVNDYWTKLVLVKNEDDFISINSSIAFSQKGITDFNTFKTFIENSIRKNFLDQKIIDSDGDISVYISKTEGWKKFFAFKNNFFREINLKGIENWVDIENEYYTMLKEIVKSNHRDDTKEEKLKLVKKLNDEFDQIKRLLKNYLVENINNRFGIYMDGINDFVSIFQSNLVRGLHLQRFYQEIPKSDSDFFTKQFNKERSLLTLQERTSHIPEIIFENYYLSFNYTFTASTYIQHLGVSPLNLNEIHGSLEDEANPINFGFGDEMDKFYQEIEEVNDNEYLRNIKSFQYLHTPNYKRLLDLIDSEKFQVYIMGHSCGLSDRTLLNTIFEHDNCRSIKIYYHEIKDESGKVIKDNYTEITQNISRHFNKKKLMREKIVNKTLCQPLPQTKLPKHKIVNGMPIITYNK